MGNPPGRPPKPIEERRRTRAGHRPIPQAGSLMALPGTSRPPEPPRPLGLVGRAQWERIWRAGAVWLAANIDVETILVLCEQIDERETLRKHVVEYPGDWRERTQLRALTKDIIAGLGSIGFNPVDRTRLGVAEVESKSPLDELIARRQSRSGS